MIKLINVSKFYQTENQIAQGLRKVNLEIGLNEFVAITGESGSGKSTLLNVISGIDTYEEGEMLIDGEETSSFTKTEWEEYRRNFVGFVFQNYNLIDSYTVLENVEAAMILMNYSEETRRQRALEIIARVGLSNHLHQKASKLSGGQKQRVVIARALAKDTPIIACDEPTGNLDSESGKQIIALLKEISENKLVLIVTHDFSEVEKVATRKIRMFDGEIVEDIVLSPTKPQDLKSTIQEPHHHLKDVLLMALRNIKSTPRRTIFTIFFLLISSMILSAEFGSFINSTTNNQNVNTYYPNSMECRVDVVNKNKAPFTQEAIADVLSVEGVKTYSQYDLALDCQLDFYISSEEFYNAPEIKGTLLPSTIISESELSYGHLPEIENEVVVITSTSRSLDDVQRLVTGTFSGSATYGFYRYYNNVNLKIAGILECSKLGLDGSANYLIVHDDMLSKINQNMMIITMADFSINYTSNLQPATTSAEILANDYLYHANPIIVPVDDVAENVINYYAFEVLEHGAYDASLTRTQYYDTLTYDNLTMNVMELSSISESIYPYGYIEVNESVYNELIHFELYQFSVFTESVSLSDSVASMLNYKGYSAFYIAGAETNQLTAIIVLLSTFVLLLGLIVSFIVIFFITYLILRRISVTKKKDYLILRSIGASHSFISQLILAENVILSVSSSVLCILLIIASKEFIPISILNTFAAFSSYHYYILILIFVAIAFLLSIKVRNYLFKGSVNKTMKSVE